MVESADAPAKTVDLANLTWVEGYCADHARLLEQSSSLRSCRDPKNAPNQQKKLKRNLNMGPVYTTGWR